MQEPLQAGATSDVVHPLRGAPTASRASFKGTQVNPLAVLPCEGLPGASEVCAVNFHAGLPLSPSNTEGIRAMARDIRAMPERHRARRPQRALIETSPEGEAITALGRERLVSDR